jgi:hypothetical protein
MGGRTGGLRFDPEAGPASCRALRRGRRSQAHACERKGSGSSNDKVRDRAGGCAAGAGIKAERETRLDRHRQTK